MRRTLLYSLWNFPLVWFTLWWRFLKEFCILSSHFKEMWKFDIKIILSLAQGKINQYRCFVIQIFFKEFRWGRNEFYLLVIFLRGWWTLLIIFKSYLKCKIKIVNWAFLVFDRLQALKFTISFVSFCLSSLHLKRRKFV